MDDDRLVRHLRVVDTPSEPRAAFVEDLHARLSDELGFATADGRPLTGPERRPRRRRGIGLVAIAAATLVALGALGSGFIGRPATVDLPIPPPTSTGVSATPGTTRPASASPDVSAIPASTPSILALRGPGLVVFEHWPQGQPTSGLTRLEYLAPDGTGHELLPDVAGLQKAPVWRPDGARLAFSGFDPATAQQPSIWETDAAGAAPRRIGADCGPPACVGETDPAYSTNGKALAFVRADGSVDGAPATSVLAVRDLATGSVTELETTRTDAVKAILRHPSWSPDGRLIAFGTSTWTSDGRGIVSTISVVDLESGPLRPLTPIETQAGDPDWSTDGSLILFSSRPIVEMGDADGMHLYTVRPDGSDIRQLDTDGGVGAAIWSADGSQILYTSVTGFQTGAVPGLGAARPNLMVMEPDGTDVRPLTAFGTCCRWYATQQPTP